MLKFEMRTCRPSRAASLEPTILTWQTNFRSTRLLLSRTCVIILLRNLSRPPFLVKIVCSLGAAAFASLSFSGNGGSKIVSSSCTRSRKRVSNSEYRLLIVKVFITLKLLKKSRSSRRWFSDNYTAKSNNHGRISL